MYTHIRHGIYLYEHVVWILRMDSTFYITHFTLFIVKCLWTSQSLIMGIIELSLFSPYILYPKTSGWQSIFLFIVNLQPVNRAKMTYPTIFMYVNYTNLSLIGSVKNDSEQIAFFVVFRGTGKRYGKGASENIAVLNLHNKFAECNIFIAFMHLWEKGWVNLTSVHQPYGQFY